MPADFNGTWILETNDQFEEYLKALSKKLLIWVGFNLLEMLCVKIVFQGDVTGWTHCTINKIIQFHVLSI